MSDVVSSGETMVDQIALYFLEEPSNPNLNFEEFLQACADETDDVCVLAPRAVCAFDLVSSVAQGVHRGNFDESAQVSAWLADLILVLADMSQEVFLARQLNAF